ncbi:MAG: hypothetical protein K0R24_297 [Gammaproteobacteria bacterium]|jgi:hypothetical protein|nr:hypothetical protein [Gammaproteobacteria bacterium]
MWAASLTKLGKLATQSAGQIGGAAYSALTAAGEALKTVEKKQEESSDNLIVEKFVETGVGAAAVAVVGAAASGGIISPVATTIVTAIGVTGVLFAGVASSAVKKLLNDQDYEQARIDFKKAILNKNVEGTVGINGNKIKGINELLTDYPYLLICTVPDEKSTKSFIELVVELEKNFPKSFKAIFNNLPALVLCFMESLQTDGNNKLNDHNIRNIGHILKYSPQVLLESWPLDSESKRRVFHRAVRVLENDDYSYLLKDVLLKYKEETETHPEVFEEVISQCYDNPDVPDKIKNALKTVAPELWEVEGQRRRKEEEQEALNQVLALQQAERKRLKREREAEKKRRAEEISLQRQQEADCKNMHSEAKEKQEEAYVKTTQEEKRIQALKEAEEKRAAEEKEAEQEGQRKAELERSKAELQAKEKMQTEQEEKNKADTKRFSPYPLPSGLNFDTEPLAQENEGLPMSELQPTNVAEQTGMTPMSTHNDYCLDGQDGIDNPNGANAEWTYPILSEQANSTEQPILDSAHTPSSLATTVNSEHVQAKQKQPFSTSIFLRMACFLTGGLATLAAIVLTAHMLFVAGVPPVIAYGVGGVSIAAVGLFGLRKVDSLLKQQHLACELSNLRVLPQPA